MLSSWKRISSFKLPSKRTVNVSDGRAMASALDRLLAALWPIADKDMPDPTISAEGLAALNRQVADLLRTIKENYYLNMEIDINIGKAGDIRHVLSLDLFKLQSALMHVHPDLPLPPTVVRQLHNIYFDLNEFQLEAETRTGM